VSEEYKTRFVPGQGELRFPLGMTDAQIDEAMRRWMEAASGTPRTSAAAGSTPTTAPAPAGVPDASAPAVEDRPPPGGPWQPARTEDTLRQMGADSTGWEKFGLGALQSGARTARAIGLPQALRAAGLNLDPEGDTALGKVAEGTGWQGTVGDVAGSIPQAIGIGKLLAGLAPAQVSALAAKYPSIAAYLASAGIAGGTSAVMTPGGPAERGKAAAGSAALALPFTLAARTIAQPVKMSAAGKRLQATTGEVPPVHLGAESKLVRDTGEILQGLPIAGSRISGGEERIINAGLRQLWKQATPPGKPVLLGNEHLTRGHKIFGELATQFDEVYDDLLSGVRVPVTNADRLKVTRLIDKHLVPEDAAKLHKLMGNYFPKGNFIGGEKWKHLQEIVRSKANSYLGGQDPVARDMGEVLEKVDKILVTMRNRGVPASVAQKLDATDAAYSVRKLLEKSAGYAGSAEKVTPKMLERALVSRTSEAGLARGHGTGQPVVDALASTITKPTEGSVSTALWQARRLMNPGLASAAGFAAGGIPGMIAVPGTVAAANLIGAGPKGAKAMFGQYDWQRALSEALRRKPEVIPGTMSGLVTSLQE